MNDLVPEFSRLIGVERIPDQGCEEILSPKPNEQAALAKRFDLLELTHMKAVLTLKPELRGTIAAFGRLRADVVQQCVVTLEPLTTRINAPLKVLFIPAHLQNTHAESGDVDTVEEDIEYYTGGKIDLGEWVAQHLGLNLDPYPRKPDAALVQTEFGPVDEKPHPFAQLADLAQMKKNKDKTEN